MYEYIHCGCNSHQRKIVMNLMRGQSKVIKYEWRGTKTSTMFILLTKNCMSIVLLQVKLQLQQMKTVEMRAKSVWCVTICRFTPIFLPPEFLTKKHGKISTFLNAFFKKKFHQSSECTRKIPHPCSFSMESTSWGWLTICGGT